MYQTFAAFMKNLLGSEEQKEFAARLGISGSQLSKILQGHPVERTTLAKIVTGVSAQQKVRAQCLAAYLTDWLPLAGPAAERIQIRVK